MKKRMWLLTVLAIVVICAVALSYGLFYMWFRPPVLPVPNGYDDLLRAAKMLAPRTGFYHDMSAEELTVIVAQNEPALSLTRAALHKECKVIVDWSAGPNGLASHLDQIQLMRELARAFAAAARLAKKNGEVEQAIECGFDSFALANATATGGLLIDRQVALVVYYLGLSTLRNQVASLSRKDCEQLQKKVATSPLQLESLDDMLRRDMAFVKQTRGYFTNIMMGMYTQSNIEQIKETMHKIEQGNSVYRPLLQTHIALRAFQLDHNRLPQTLDELVPDYLPQVPQDPFAAGPIIYHCESDNYHLYSIGPDKTDNDGVETEGNKTGDLFLEVSD